MADEKNRRTEHEPANLLGSHTEDPAQNKISPFPTKLPTAPVLETQRLTHDLQVHQIELELQNVELRRIQIALDSSRTAYMNLYNFAPVGYCTLNFDGLIVEANHSASKLLGTAVNALENQALTQFIKDEDQDTFYFYFKQFKEDGLQSTSELRMQHANGTIFWVVLAIKAALHEDDDNIPVNFYIAISDITTKKKADADRALLAAERTANEQMIAAAESAIKQRSLFLAMMSHEIRTPLAAILGFSELKPQDLSQATEYLEAITRNANHLNSLVESTLDLASIESGNTSLVANLVDVRLELNGVLAMLLPRAREKGIDLNCSIPSNLPKFLSTDALRLRQVLINLIGNAIKFTDTGSVSVSVLIEKQEPSKSISRVVFRITDSGRGIAPDMHSQIFEIYCQEGDSKTKRCGGSGLGLTLSRHLARLLGGDLVLINAEQGRGSTFEFSIAPGPSESRDEIPANSNAQLPITADSPPKILQGLRILVVEDQPDIRLFTEILLTSQGGEIDLAANGEVGVMKALKCNYDVILMDTHMPKLDGRGATLQLRQNGCTAAIIGLTADASEAEKDMSLAAGMDAYFSKPINNEKLVQIIAEWAERKRVKQSIPGGGNG